MAKSKTVRRKPGRPATGAMPTVTIRLPTALIAGVDSLAKAVKKSRTDIMLEILEHSLAARPKAKKKA